MIYLDYNATTPVDPRVLEAMLPYFSTHFGNPSSATHAWGWRAENAVQKSREKVAQFLNCEPSEIYFTSGASEANNWSAFGVLHAHQQNSQGTPIHFITSSVEHSSVLNTFKALEMLGAEVTYLPVNSAGLVSPESLQQAIRPHTKLISIIWVNNETGSINDVTALGEVARKSQIYFHTDATQAIGKLAVNLHQLPIDLMSFSGHKIYAPKGVGALFMRQKNPRVAINPLIFGGGQERGQRAGTLNVPSVVGLGKACEILSTEMSSEIQRLTNLRDHLWSKLQKSIPGLTLNGDPQHRVGTTLNFSNSQSSIDLLLPKLQKIGFSTGAACGSGNMQGSHVLRAMGVSPALIENSMRLSLGRPSTEAEIDQTVEILKSALIK